MTDAIFGSINTAAESLAGCLLEMAEAETNPILQIIDPYTRIEENKKYPPGLLQFNESGWRAYYHCHPSTRTGNHRFEGEHGHFHIFIRCENEIEVWSHLVALAMDNMGQPIGWFTVNQWVTGETWQDADILINQLKVIPYNKQTTLTERWLLSLLVLNQDKITTILYERDKLINELQDADANKKIKQDKSIYILSETNLNLKKLLNDIMQSESQIINQK